MALKKKSRKSSRPKSELSLMNLKVSRKDRLQLEKKAQKHQNGNLSAWLRRAGLNYTPIEL